MAKFYFLFLSCFIGISFQLSAQNVEWLTDVSGNLTSKTLVTDESGNSYFGGNFIDTAYFGSQKIYSSNYHFFISKYDSTGKFLWVDTSVGKGGFLHKCKIVELYNNKKLYVLGVGDSILIKGNYQALSTDNFIAQYDTAGDPIWANNLPNNFSPKDISSGLFGNIYIGGFIDGQVIFGNDTFNKNGSNGDAFLVKYDSSGNYLWARKGKSTGFTAQIRSITVDKSGNIYSGGNFSDSLNFASERTQFNKTTPFLVKHDSSGQVKWLKKLKEYSTGRGFIDQVKANKSNDVYIAGKFKDSIKIGNDLLKGVSSSATFITKINPNGNFQWNAKIGIPRNKGTGSVSNYGISSANNFLYLGGSLGSSKKNTPFVFGNDTIKIGGPNNNFSPYITKLHSFYGLLLLNNVTLLRLEDRGMMPKVMPILPVFSMIP